MALNELLIISIQTRLKGSLLIGHRKQEPLLVLHNCPLLEVHGTGVRGVTLSGMGWPSRGPCAPPRVLCPHLGCVPMQGCACSFWVMHANREQVYTFGAVRVHLGLCVSIWGCVCPFGIVHACMRPHIYIQHCMCPRGDVCL